MRSVVNVINHDLLVHTDHRTFFEEVFCPSLLFVDDSHQAIIRLVTHLKCDFTEARINFDQLIHDVRSPLGVERFILQDQGDDVTRTDEDTVLNHAQ